MPPPLCIYLDVTSHPDVLERRLERTAEVEQRLTEAYDGEHEQNLGMDVQDDGLLVACLTTTVLNVHEDVPPGSLARGVDAPVRLVPVARDVASRVQPHIFSSVHLAPIFGDLAVL